LAAVMAVIVIVIVLGWMATKREWRPVSALAVMISSWDESQGNPDALRPELLARGTDADIASLSKGLHGFVTRIADYNQRERNFTRDASHELRSPLTVIKMSVDMLADEEKGSAISASVRYAASSVPPVRWRRWSTRC
jgi:two-component system sensor histidine kinase QseC